MIKYKKLYAVGLSVVLLGTNVYASSAQLQKQKDAKKVEQDSLQQKITESRQNVNQLDSEMKNVSSELKALDGQISVQNTKIVQLSEEIYELQDRIAENLMALDEAKINLEDKKELFSKRVRAMYMSGQAGYIEVLMNSKSIEELITNNEMIRSISKSDRELIEFIREQIDTINLKTEELKNDELELQSKKSEVESVKNSLVIASNEKQVYMDQLINNKELYARELANMENTSAQVEAELKSLTSQITIAKEQEEAARQARLARERSSGSERLSLTYAPERRNGKKLMWPVPGNSRISSPFGYRIHPILGYSRMHTGVDIPASSGTPVVAAKDGVVIKSTFMSGYGNVIMIDHGDCVTVYAHNSSLKAREGQSVTAGEVVSYVGSTGLSTGPHLHFEVRFNGSPVDPLGYI